MLKIICENKKTVIQFQKLYPHAKEGFGRIFQFHFIFLKDILSFYFSTTQFVRGNFKDS